MQKSNKYGPYGRQFVYYLGPDKEYAPYRNLNARFIKIGAANYIDEYYNNLEEIFLKDKTSNKMEKNKAVFAGLKDVLIEDVSFDNEVPSFKFKEGVLEFLRTQRKDGFCLIIVESFTEIEEGKLKPSQIESLLEKVEKEISLYTYEKPTKYLRSYIPTFIKATYIADHKISTLRKPLTTAAILAERDYDIDLSKSAVLGSGDNDKAFAFNSQISFYIDVEQLKPKKEEVKQENDSNK